MTWCICDTTKFRQNAYLYEWYDITAFLEDEKTPEINNNEEKVDDAHGHEVANHVDRFRMKNDCESPEGAM